MIKQDLRAVTAAHLAHARPKVLAALTRYFRDIDLAEDAFQEASVRALARWTEAGVPRDPAAWLIVTGRNVALDSLRRNRRERDYAADILAGTEADGHDVEAQLAAVIDMDELRDDVLRLLFMCSQPDLPVTDQLALALKVVGGLSVAQIARAFIVGEKAMEQRITRAKKKAAKIAADLDPPSLGERAARLKAVELMIYLMFSEGYSAGGGPVHIRSELCEEAIRLARLLLSLFPAQPETMGLLALCLAQHSRRTARLDAQDRLIPLDEQDRSLWDREQIAEAKVLTEKALRRGKPGPYQIQAAIACVHAAAETAEVTDWAEIGRLYAALEAVQPTPVVTLNRAVALSKIEGPRAALELLAPLRDELAGYLHFHTARASLLTDVGDRDGALAAWQCALDLGPTEAETAHIEGRIIALGKK